MKTSTFLLLIGVVVGYLDHSEPLQGFQLPIDILLDSYRCLLESEPVDIVKGSTLLDKLFVRFLRQLLDVCRDLDRNLYERMYVVGKNIE